MEASDNQKFLIDGFPRSEENRAAFEQIVSLTVNLATLQFELKEVQTPLLLPLLSSFKLIYMHLIYYIFASLCALNMFSNDNIYGFTT